MKEKVFSNQIEDHTERQIISFLNNNGKSTLGNILMNSKLSYRKGYQYLNTLIDKNWVSHTDDAPYYTLKIDFE
jgi:predicted transcriptional regulator